MIVYLVVSIPASWAIDTWGMRAAVGIGAVLTGRFGLLRGLVAPHYTLVLAAQIGIAIGQPFILNATTKVAAQLVPAGRARHGRRAGLVGDLCRHCAGPGPHARAGGLAATWPRRCSVYGIAAVVTAVAFFVVGRETDRRRRPARRSRKSARAPLTGLREAIREPRFRVLLVVLFVGLGVFNGVTTWIEDIVRPRGFDSGAGGARGRPDGRGRHRGRAGAADAL